jgi:RNA polymerase sigma factor (sigma-70 family)
MNSFDKRRAPVETRELAFQAGWEDLVRRYDPMLRGHVHRSLLRAGFAPEAVEDWVQETYCRLLDGGPPRLRQLRSLAAGQVINYLTRVAHGVITDEQRARAAHKRGGGGRLRGVRQLSEIADRMVDPRANPEEEALRGELRRLLFTRCEALVDARLPAEERRRAVRILRRVFLAGWTTSEVVRAEGGRMARSSVHALVHRARRRLAAAPPSRVLRRGRYHGRP